MKRAGRRVPVYGTEHLKWVPVQYTEVKAKLKQALAEQDLTYGQLGRRIGMSESGVKKLFSAHDISLERLAQI